MNCIKSIFLIPFLATAHVAKSETIEELLAAGKLEARAFVETPAPHFQKAPIEIVVEVGTPDRFKGGTRVRNFSIPGTVVRRLTKSAFNETRRRDGDSWAFQSWRIAIHSERTGDLSVPELTTFISIETESDEVVEGEIKLSVPPLKIEEPPGTASLDSWVAANTFTGEETWEGILETYEIGDAVTRVRRFTITGSPAMAIPASPSIELAGVDVYQAPPLVDDNEVGGSLEGVREERMVFTFKGGGTFQIPEQSISWFNLETSAVEQIELPGRSLEVSGPPVSKPAVKPEPRGNSKGLWLVILAVLCVVLGYFLVRWIGRSNWFRQLGDLRAARQSHRRLKAAFMDAAARQDSKACLELLYQRMSENAEWQLSTAFANDPQLRAASDALMAHAFGNGPPPEVSEVQRLWEGCEISKEERDSPNPLQLNPGPSP